MKMLYGFTEKYSVILLFLSISLFSLGGRAFASWEHMELKLDPDHIEIGTFYNGTTITAKGKIPTGSQVVLRITGHYTKLHLKKKGKIGGLLWMNIGDVTVGNVPEVFVLVCSKNMKDRIDDPELNLGYRFLEKMMTIEPEGEDKEFIFKEFVKLQEKSRTYGIFYDNVKYTGKADGFRTFEAVIPIPPKMKQGEYRVEAFAIKDNTILASSSEAIQLKQVGFPALISKLAFGYPLLYGIGAVMIAIFAGLLMGILFKGGGSH